MPAFSTDNPDSAALGLVAQLLFSESAPLYQELVVDKQWVDFVGGESSSSLAVNVVRRTGQVVIVGLFGGEFRMPLPLFPLKSLRIEGSYVAGLEALRELVALAQRTFDVPVIGVIEPGARAAVKATTNRRVGVIGFTEFRNSLFTPLAERGLETFDLEYDVRAFRERLPRVRIIPIEEFDPLLHEHVPGVVDRDAVALGGEVGQMMAVGSELIRIEGEGG